MAKQAKKAGKVQTEELKYVPMRKVARIMTLIAGALASCIVHGRGPRCSLRLPAWRSTLPTL